MAISYFSSPTVAERYARSRPDINGRFNDTLLRHTGPLGVVADFGCGTGISTRALTEVARHVVGLDPSLAMLAHADAHPQVGYCAGVAEASPFAASSIELVAAGLALHWFERDLFIEEAARVLVPRGWLFIYNTWFNGIMRDRPEFGEWNRNQYLTRYPTPPRTGKPIVASDSPLPGFTLRESWNIEAGVAMSSEQLSRYLTTQSNVSAVVERQQESIDGATQWLHDSVAPFFASPQEEFLFSGSAWLLQRV